MDGYFPTSNTGPVATDFQEPVDLATSFGNEAEKANAGNINRFVNEDRFDGIGTSQVVVNDGESGSYNYEDDSDVSVPTEEVRPVRMWFDNTFVSKIMKYEIGLVCRVLYVLANLILPGILALVDLIQYTIKQEQYLKERKVYCL